MKRTYLLSELPTDKEECINVLLSGCTIKNPYQKDFFKLAGLQRAVNIVNDLIDKKDTMLPKGIKKIKLPHNFKIALKELEKKMCNWKIWYQAIEGEAYLLRRKS